MMQQQPNPTDLPQLQSTMHTIELACASIQMHINPAAAEATILSLNQLPHPYMACKFILENSQIANARFQAAAAIRDAAIREWGFLSNDDKISLISYCLCYAMQHASSPEGYVQVKVYSVAAQLIKRGWLEFTSTEKETFFYQVNQAVVGFHGVDVQFSGIKFLESLVSEFSPSTSSAMGLPREFHNQCQMSLELDYLKTFYCWAKDAAVGVTKRIAESAVEVPEVKVCTAALLLMLQVLNWDFQQSITGTKTGINVFMPGVKVNSSTSKKTECAIVQPGPAWHDVLISSGHVGWLLGLYAALRGKFSSGCYWLDCPIAVSARKLIVQFCSLTGTIFPADNGQDQEHHLLRLLSGIIPWIDPPYAVAQAIECGRSESELLDGCRALLSMATVMTPFVFDQLLKSTRPYGTLTLISTLMCEVIKALMSKNTDQETWSWEARDILLDIWTTLLVPMDGSGGNALLPSEGIHAAGDLFSLIAESELRVASASAMNDEEDCLQASISAMDERLSSYALIARAAIDVSVPLLTRLFSERLARLHQGRGIMDLIPTLEEIYSLLLIIGHVLADEGEGETPLVPNTIQTHFVDTVEADKHPVVVLSSSVIKFAEQCLDPEMRASVFSPRLMEAVIWFLARWSHTYLMPEEFKDSNFNSGHDHGYQFQQVYSRKSLLNFFGEQNQGKLVLDIIVRISVTTILSYPGEKVLQGLTCDQLLDALVRRKNICIHLVTLDSWRELASAFANEKVLFLLNAPNQRSLAQTLVLSASGIRNSESSNQYVRDLMGPMTNFLVELSNKNNLKVVSQQPDVILSVSCLLERLRGAAGASEPRTQRALYEMGFSVTNPILVLLEVYKHELFICCLNLLLIGWMAKFPTWKLKKLLLLLISACGCFSSTHLTILARYQCLYQAACLVRQRLRNTKICVPFFSFFQTFVQRIWSTSHQIPLIHKGQIYPRLFTLVFTLLLH